jgi:hypothetical protein
MRSSLLLIATALSTANAQRLTWFAASDTHFGHDVGEGANFTTSFTKNVWAINEVSSVEKYSGGMMEGTKRKKEKKKRSESVDPFFSFLFFPISLSPQSLANDHTAC